MNGCALKSKFLKQQNRCRSECQIARQEAQVHFNNIFFLSVPFKHTSDFIFLFTSLPTPLPFATISCQSRKYADKGDFKTVLRCRTCLFISVMTSSLIPVSWYSVYPDWNWNSQKPFHTHKPDFITKFTPKSKLTVRGCYSNILPAPLGSTERYLAPQLICINISS